MTPLYTYAVLVLFGAAWIVVYCYMITGGPAQEDPTTTFITWTDSSNSHFVQMFWYYLFGLFWICEFIIACSELSLAGAVASWYFTRDKSTLHAPLTSSIYRLIRYHIGSAAFGSLIIAIVSVRWVIKNKIIDLILGLDGV